MGSHEDRVMTGRNRDKGKADNNHGQAIRRCRSRCLYYRSTRMVERPWCLAG